MIAQASSHAHLDGSFELVPHANGARIIRRPTLKRLHGDIPHLVAGFEVCRLSDHAPEGFADQVLGLLNDAHAWGQI